MTNGNVIAFPPRTTEAQIRAEAERQRDQRHAQGVADHALDYADYDQLAALAILKRAARIILQTKPRTPPPEPEDVA